MTGARRIERRFASLKAEGRAGLVTFVTAGDPDDATSRVLLAGLAPAGADVIELGMPFSDPMADGPAIQASSQRALRAGASVRRTLAMARDFRRDDDATPLILMGYFNPIHAFGVDAFMADANAAGVDGLIVVDVPHEEASQLALGARSAGLSVIVLVAPTTDEARLPRVLEDASGFVYYVSVTGITGTTSAAADVIRTAVARLRRHTDLPVAVGFGIRTPTQAAEVARVADAAVVGSALVEKVAENLKRDGTPRVGLVKAVLTEVRALARGVRTARDGTRRP